MSIVNAHSKKLFHLGFGREVVKLANLSKSNASRDYRIFEEFALHLIDTAQQKRINTPFELDGKFYAFYSSIIDLCIGLFWWAKYKSTSSGIKLHTLYDVATQIPAFIHISIANVSDNTAMDVIPYETQAYYIFDKGYFDLARLYRINLICSYFVTRQKGNLQYNVLDEDDMLGDASGILSDQVIELTGPLSKKKYPGRLRRIVYYSEEHHRSFVYITNAFYIRESNIALLYKKRWQIELFFKWIKQHLYIKSFVGTSENAVKIQIYIAVSAYCLIAIAEHDMQLNRSMYDVLRILRGLLLDKSSIRELFAVPVVDSDKCSRNNGQLSLDF